MAYEWEHDEWRRAVADMTEWDRAVTDSETRRHPQGVVAAGVHHTENRRVTTTDGATGGCSVVNCTRTERDCNERER